MQNYCWGNVVLLYIQLLISWVILVATFVHWKMWSIRLKSSWFLPYEPRGSSNPAATPPDHIPTSSAFPPGRLRHNGIPESPGPIDTWPRSSTGRFGSFMRSIYSRSPCLFVSRNIALPALGNTGLVHLKTSELNPQKSTIDDAYNHNENMNV